MTYACPYRMLNYEDDSTRSLLGSAPRASPLPRGSARPPSPFQLWIIRVQSTAHFSLCPTLRFAFSIIKSTLGQRTVHRRETQAMCGGVFREF